MPPRPAKPRPQSNQLSRAAGPQRHGRRQLHLPHQGAECEGGPRRDRERQRQRVRALDSSTLVAPHLGHLGRRRGTRGRRRRHCHCGREVRPRRSRLDRLEDDVLNENRPLAPVLRQAIALGGHAHSEQLRAWALRELQGYEGTDVPIPDYRRITAPLVMDGLAGRFQFRQQPVSMFDLPDFARDNLGDELRLGQGVGQIESLLARNPEEIVRLSPAMAAELAVFMSQNSSRQVLRLYWAVHPSALEGVLDQVRTRLVQLVGELRATMPHGQQDPTAEQVAQALQNINIVAGDHSSVTVTAPVAVAHKRGSARAETVGGAQHALPRTAIVWAVLTVLAASTAVAAWIIWI
ncbi:AbiTii domain-containing protein [Streptomyces murinus]|uniref:AbiTii domain-containing protein n=1 Tax=Streptomyces murinus TaxID=33900 RepID=UPI00380A0662